MPSALKRVPPDLSAEGRITGWKADMQITPSLPVHVPGRNLCLALSGDFTEPVRGVSAFRLSLWAARDESMQACRPSMGAFFKQKVLWSGSVFLGSGDFDSLLALACADRLQYCNIGLRANGRELAITHLWISTEVPVDVAASPLRS